MSRTFAVELTRAAEKDLDDLRSLRDRAVRKLLALESNPYAGHDLKKDLLGIFSLGFALPGGEYRAAYVIQEEKQRCLIFAVGPHEGFYDLVRRRAKGLGFV
jgi:mRNA-degrading endonuclease RelE of RelBE toxin-antitoxin system